MRFLNSNLYLKHEQKPKGRKYEKPLLLRLVLLPRKRCIRLLPVAWGFWENTNISNKYDSRTIGLGYNQSTSKNFDWIRVILVSEWFFKQPYESPENSTIYIRSWWKLVTCRTKNHKSSLIIRRISKYLLSPYTYICTEFWTPITVKWSIHIIIVILKNISVSVWHYGYMGNVFKLIWLYNRL